VDTLPVLHVEDAPVSLVPHRRTPPFFPLFLAFASALLTFLEALEVSGEIDNHRVVQVPAVTGPSIPSPNLTLPYF